MRIAFLNLASDHDWGGGEWWTIRAAKGLSDRGHNVFVLGRIGSRMVFYSLENGVHAYSVPAGIDYLPTTIRECYKILKLEKSEVFVVHHNKDVRTGGVAAKLAGIPVVHRNGFPILHNNIRHRITNTFTTRILTNSERIKETYLKFPWMDESKIDVVYNGVQPFIPSLSREEIRREWDVEDHELVLLFAGRLTSVKRVDVLINALAKIQKPNFWRLIVLGDGGEKESLQKFADSQKLNAKVSFMGFLKDAHDYFPGADLIALPSEEEGMPNTLMEAMYLGVPVAATPAGDVPYLFDHGNAGKLMEMGDIECWVSLLNVFKKERETYFQRAMIAKDRIQKHFTFRSMISGIEHSLSQAVTENE
ncbi:glycosyltransferase [bacterium]|nr:glycosyltransferase [bacterium]